VIPLEKNILIIEDELTLLNIVSAYFEKAGYKVYKAENGLDGLEIYKTKQIDVICCDVMMPLIDGWQVVQSVRQTSDIPIVLMTALDSEVDQLKGYKLNIDDYVTKPFSPSVLVAKVNRLTSKDNSHNNTNKNSIKYEGLEVNFSSRKCMVNNQEIHLSKTEFDLLAYLIKNADIVIDRVTILDEDWGMNVYVEERVVDTNIKVLRKRLKEYGSFIKTVFGVGYKFEYEKTK